MFIYKKGRKGKKEENIQRNILRPIKIKKMVERLKNFENFFLFSLFSFFCKLYTLGINS
jgi:hypothetical protein